MPRCTPQVQKVSPSLSAEFTRLCLYRCTHVCPYARVSVRVFSPGVEKKDKFSLPLTRLGRRRLRRTVQSSLENR